jgi:hypothetical protein
MVDMEVGAADPGCRHLDHHVIGAAERRWRHVLERNARRRVEFPQRKHRMLRP